MRWAAGPRPNADRLAEAADLRRNRYPVRENALPPLGRELQTQLGCAVFDVVTGEVVELAIAARFYPGVAAGSGTLVWTTRRRATHDELVQAWPARAAPDPAELARGSWQPIIEVLREEGRRAASLERARDTRRSREFEADTGSRAGR